ncbi:hypothetical protein Agabi119p4_9943 [Agaricus bisporus var. burnettii]|uniref:Uncharacterized protein n=1 Tax=Agaricus bisporus var. burnettii TaxID=192524 RepID=A0A8H7EXA6_AGABI|nr:hypothetical protein Agabi119p4_9943 [Agaricus bisporus var. burnettii]
MPARRTRLSANDLEFIDEVMRRYAYFKRIFNEQNDVFYANQVEYQAALARFDGGKNSPHPIGPNWRPAQDQIENYLKMCETLCCKEINDFVDRIIVQHASHAGLIMIEIHNQQQLLSTLPETFCSSMTLSATSSSSATSCSIVEPAQHSRSLIPEEITRFMTSFDSLAGKRFVLYPDETEEITYQVASYCTIRKQYEILSGSVWMS